MRELKDCLSEVFKDEINKITVSKPALKSNEFIKLVAEKKSSGWQLTKYTQKQAFHENMNKAGLILRLEELISGNFRQLNAWSLKGEHIILISKDLSCSYKFKKAIKQSSDGSADNSEGAKAHNRQKKYLLEEGKPIAPLVDMGIFTAEGKVVKSMYDKFRQINRFIEILDDEISKSRRDEINVIDFGCGKSYLTFLIYYYLVEVKKIKANIIGLDLKADVINKCNEAAVKYGYSGLRFELGDINGYKAPFDVDMVVTLHACDTATDYALFNAVSWNAKMIFSVPCCQHELNRQAKTENLSIMTRYGIIQERFSALATDAIRANLLEYMGYKTQLLEFIDFEHTPKNILIRAVKRPVTVKAERDKKLSEVESLMKEFDFRPTFYDLLIK